jgi:co-chaperonin GroES (HSP10)
MFQLIGNRIAVRPDPIEETSGLIVPDSARDVFVYGTVAHVGRYVEIVQDRQMMIEAPFTVGDRVFYNRFNASTIQFQGEELSLLHSTEVIFAEAFDPNELEGTDG